MWRIDFMFHRQNRWAILSYHEHRTLKAALSTVRFEHQSDIDAGEDGCYKYSIVNLKTGKRIIL